MAGTWMVVVTKVALWGGRRGVGPGVPCQVLVPQGRGDVEGSGGPKPLVLLCLEEDRCRLGSCHARAPRELRSLHSKCTGFSRTMVPGLCSLEGHRAGVLQL